MAISEDIRVAILVESLGAESTISNLQKVFNSLGKGVESASWRMSESINTVSTKLMELRSAAAEAGRQIIASLQPQGMTNKTPLFTSTPTVSAEGKVGDILRDQSRQNTYWESYFKNVQGASKVTEGFREVTKRMNMQMLGFGLSMLFTSMAIKRFADSALKSILKTYSEVTENQTAVGKGIMGLQAAFEFLKFSIIEAIDPEVFLKVLDWLTGIVNAISRFVGEHPRVAQFIVTFLAIASVLAGVGMVFGQISLLAVGLGIKLLPLMGIIATIGIASALLFAIWTSDGSNVNKIIATIGVTLLAVLGVMFSLGKTQAIVAALGAVWSWLGKSVLAATIVGAILAVIIALANMQEAFGGLGNFALAVFAGIGKAAIMLGSILIEGILTVIEMLIIAGQKLADIIGWDSMADKLSNAAYAIDKARQVGKQNSVDAIYGLDTWTGMDKIRQNNPEVENLLKVVSGQTDYKVQDFSKLELDSQAQLATMQEQQKSLDKLSGGSSIAKLEEIQKQSKDELTQIKNDLKNNTGSNNLSFNFQGIDLQNDSRLKSVINETLDDYFRNKSIGTGTPVSG